MKDLSNLSIKVVTTQQQLTEIKQSWINLQSQLGTKFYTDFFFYRSYFENICHINTSPYLILIFQSKQLIAIFPWEKRQKSILGLPYYEIGSMEHSHVDLNDILCEKNNKNTLIEMLFKMKSQLPTLSIFCLPKIKANSQLAKLLFSQTKLNHFYWNTCESKHLQFDETPLPEVLPKKHLKNINRLLRKAEREGKCQFLFINGKDITQEQIQIFLEMEASGWKGEKGSSSAILLNDDLKNFYSSLFEHNKENIQLNFYYFNGVPVAAHFCFLNDETISLAKVCYLQNYSNLSPSHVLIYKAIEDAQLNNKAKKISFVTGPSWLSPWKPKSTTVKTFIFPMGVSSWFIFNIVKYSRMIINQFHKVQQQYNKKPSSR